MNLATCNLTREAVLSILQGVGTPPTADAVILLTGNPGADGLTAEDCRPATSRGWVVAH